MIDIAELNRQANLSLEVQFRLGYSDGFQGDMPMKDAYPYTAGLQLWQAALYREYAAGFQAGCRAAERRALWRRRYAP